MKVLNYELNHFMLTAPFAMFLVQEDGNILQKNSKAEDILTRAGFADLKSLSILDIPWLNGTDQLDDNSSATTAIKNILRSSQSEYELLVGLNVEGAIIQWYKLSVGEAVNPNSDAGLRMIYLIPYSKELRQKAASDYRTGGQQFLLKVSEKLHYLNSDQNLLPVLTRILKELGQMYAVSACSLHYSSDIESFIPSYFRWADNGVKISSKKRIDSYFKELKDLVALDKSSECILVNVETNSNLLAKFKLPSHVSTLIMVPVINSFGDCDGILFLESNKLISRLNSAKGKALVFLASILGAFFSRFVQSWKLRERVKEINSLDRINQMCLKSDGISNAYLNDIVQDFPLGFYDPSRTQVCLIMENTVLSSPDIPEPKAEYAIKINGPNKRENVLLVKLSKGLKFLKEEKDLIKRVANSLELQWQRDWTAREMNLQNSRLSKLFSSDGFYVIRLNKKGDLKSCSNKFSNDFKALYNEDSDTWKVFETVKPKQLTRAKALIADCLKTPGKINTITFEHQLEKDSHRSKYIYWEYVALKVGGGDDIEIQCLGMDITELQLNKLKLDRFKQISDSSVNGFAISNVFGKIEYLNDQFSSLFKLKRTQILGSDTKGFFDTHFTQSQQELWNELGESHQINQRRLEIEDEEGGIKNILFSAKKVKSEQGSWYYYTLLDVSVQHQQSLELERNNNRIQALLKGIPDMLFVINAEGVYLECHQGYLNRDVDFSYLVGFNVADAHSKSVSKKILKSMYKSQSTQKVTTLQYSRKINSGKRWFESTFIPIEVDKTLQFVRDVTFQKRHEEQLRRFTIAVEQSPVGILIMDLEGYIEYASPSMQQVTGYRPEQLEGMSSRIFASGLTPQKVYDEINDALSSGSVWDGELLNRNRDGQNYWERMSISPIRNKEGEIYNFMALKQNIDIERKNREQLSVQKEIFRKIAHNQSHEVRAPLARIMGLVNLFALSEDEASKTEILQKLTESTTELDAIIRDTAEKVSEAEKLYS